MKKLLIAAFCLGTTGLVAQVRMPQPSPAQTVKQDFGLGSIEVKYSRPAAKGRAIFGDLVPFGKVWRTGANSATTIRFTDPVNFGGVALDSGIYSLYTVPNKESWEIRINKYIGSWGTSAYSDSNDVVKVKVPVKHLTDKVESFSINFDNVLPTSTNLAISWDNTQVLVPITVDVKDRIKADIEKAMNTDKKPYWTAAQFYNDYDNNPKKALEMTEFAVKDNPNQFWVWLYKARLEAKLGKKEEAWKSTRQSMKLAEEAKNDDYIKLNKDFQATL